MIVRHGERSAPSGEYCLQDVGRLDGPLVDPAVAEHHELEGPRGTVGDHDDEPLAVAMQQLGPHDIGDSGVIDEARPRR